MEAPVKVLEAEVAVAGVAVNQSSCYQYHVLVSSTVLLLLVILFILSCLKTKQNVRYTIFHLCKNVFRNSNKKILNPGLI